MPFPLDDLMKHFSPSVTPKVGRIFRADISVTLLKFLFACPPFSSNLVLFLFNSDGTALFFLLFRFLLLFGRRIYYLWFIHCRNVDLIQGRNLVFNQMKNSIIKSVWISIVTYWIIQVGVGVTTFTWWFVLWLSSSITFLNLFILSRSTHR